MNNSPRPAPHHPRPYHDDEKVPPPACHGKGGGGVERGGDPCGRPDHAPHCWRPFSHVQVFSHCAEQRCLPRSALAIRSRCGFAEMWGMVRRSPCGGESVCVTLPAPTPCQPRPKRVGEVELVRNSVLSDTSSTTTKKGQAEGYRAWRTAS